MGFYRNSDMFQFKDSKDDCVCDIVQNIVRAQKEVQEEGWNYSIRQLKKKDSLDPQYSTIPFILYTKEDGSPFIGSGIFQAPYHRNDTFFGCIESPVLRAKHFTKGSNCCVKVELLLPIANGCEIQPYSKDKHRVSAYFPEDTPVTDFLATGLCLTLELKNFTGITCLDAITPIPHEEFFEEERPQHSEYMDY
ncbi:CotY/CotZ family spore coat protein [Oceanobacillus kapialis]|uniref:CotY/CotZ family spore coat protein n=1 Tax=Oceanobacillus kapialis TaxID=481353 RepID=A0ABW5Q5H2_9BACI